MQPRERLFWPWVAAATVCCVLMVLAPGRETIPYHLSWVGIGVCYGVEPWRWIKAVSGVVGLTVVSGAILVQRAATDVIPVDELAEIPLMSLIMLVLVFNVRSRYVALQAMGDVAERDRLRAARRERLSRMTSHDLRTPVTIARGFVEMLRVSESDPQRRGDLEIVLEELQRVMLGNERLVRMMWLPEQDEFEAFDFDAVLASVRDRWQVLADRDWQVSSDCGVQVGSRDRLRSCLDTLVENSVRYTRDGDVVRIVGHVRDGLLHVGVEDAGPGFDEDVLKAVLGLDGLLPPDPLRQTGLGLGLVLEAAAIRGARLQIGRSPEGGARVMIVGPVAVEVAQDLEAADVAAPHRQVLTRPDVGTRLTPGGAGALRSDA